MEDKPIKEEKEIKFEKLTPIDDADIAGYQEALDFAFKQKDVRNIALTGSYGAGTFRWP